MWSADTCSDRLEQEKVRFVFYFLMMLSDHGQKGHSLGRLRGCQGRDGGPLDSRRLLVSCLHPVPALPRPGKAAVCVIKPAAGRSLPLTRPRLPVDGTDCFLGLLGHAMHQDTAPKPPGCSSPRSDYSTGWWQERLALPGPGLVTLCDNFYSVICYTQRNVCNKHVAYKA